MRKTYPTDLSDAEWACIEPHLPMPNAAGRPRIHPLREILNAIFYIVRSGCAWRLLPHEFPPWKTVHHYFRTWRIDGTWKKLHGALRQRVRVRMGRDPQPSAGIVDSQSVKTTWVGGDDRGYDGGKKVKGRKRHLLVDTEGLVLRAKVHAANVIDREGIEPLLEGARKMFPRLSHLWLDAGYRGEDKGRGWVEKVLGWTVDLVQRPRKPAPEEVLRSWAAEWAKDRRTGGLADAYASKRFPGTASSLGSGTHLFLDRLERTDEQRLREVDRDERSVHLRGDEPPDGEETDPFVSLFGGSQRAYSRELAWRVFTFAATTRDTCSSDY